jgi:hypothetical protein
MHARETTDNFQMAKLLGTDIHQKVLAVRVFAIEALDRILHCGRKLAIGASELL